MCKGLRFGSNSSLLGSKFTGDCLLPLLHSDHSGLIKPQNAGPETNLVVLIRFKIKKFKQLRKYFIIIAKYFIYPLEIMINNIYYFLC